MSELKAAITPARLLDESGRLVRGAKAPDAEALAEGYRKLVFARRLNEQCGALVRQGRLAVYPSSRGQEACQVACASVLAEGDWLFPTYRDTAAIAARGVDPVEVLTLLRGDWHCGYDPNEHKVAPQATPLATQLLHAVGVAHAARLKGEDTVVMALCGDGATSEGDFHVALNFAGVMNAPVVLICQNNQWAISTPGAIQTAAETIAQKAIGYGLPPVRADGNDVFAVHAAVSYAAEKARRGGGPTFVELLTYRVSAHSSSDDPSRYRDEKVTDVWRSRKDPIRRLELYLRRQGWLTETERDELAARQDEEIREVIARQEMVASPAVETLIEDVFEEPTWLLREQLAEHLAQGQKSNS